MELLAKRKHKLSTLMLFHQGLAFYGITRGLQLGNAQLANLLSQGSLKVHKADGGSAHAGIPMTIPDHVQPPALRSLIKDMTSIEAEGRPKLRDVQTRLLGLAKSLATNGDCPRYVCALHAVDLSILAMPREASSRCSGALSDGQVTNSDVDYGGTTSTRSSQPLSPKTISRVSGHAGLTLDSLHVDDPVEAQTCMPDSDAGLTADATKQSEVSKEELPCGKQGAVYPASGVAGGFCS